MGQNVEQFQKLDSYFRKLLQFVRNFEVRPEVLAIISKYKYQVKIFRNL